MTFMPKHNIFTRLRNALGQICNVQHRHVVNVSESAVDDEEVRENEARRNFDASFACSGLVDVEGIRKAIMEFKRDK